MTREPMREQELEATLTDLGERLAYPRPTRLATRSCRLREPRPGSWWDTLRSTAVCLHARARDAQ